jgi:hypothetical protein
VDDTAFSGLDIRRGVRTAKISLAEVDQGYSVFAMSTRKDTQTMEISEMPSQQLIIPWSPNSEHFGDNVFKSPVFLWLAPPRSTNCG